MPSSFPCFSNGETEVKLRLQPQQLDARFPKHCPGEWTHFAQGWRNGVKGWDSWPSELSEEQAEETSQDLT